MDFLPKPAPFGLRLYSGPLQVVGSAGANIVNFTQTALTFGNTADNQSYTFSGSGAFSVGGPATLSSTLAVSGNITRAGNTVWDASNLPVSQSATGGTVPQRTSGGYINATYFNQSSGDGENPTVGQIFVENNTGDGYLRKSSIASFGSQVKCQNVQGLSGTSVTLQADPGGTPAGSPGQVFEYY